MVTVSQKIALRRKWAETHPKPKNTVKVSGFRHNADIEDVKEEYKEKAHKWVESIMAGKRCVLDTGLKDIIDRGD